VDPVELSFVAPDKLLNMNTQLHRYIRASQVKQWRTAAFYHARAAGIRALGPSVIEWTIDFPSKRRRDPHNFFPTLKPIIDGFVDAGLWPDDTPQWVSTTEPTLTWRPRDATRHPPHISIRICSRSAS
jgi:crossover junction endodeoxyribonuclease RusA